MPVKLIASSSEDNHYSYERSRESPNRPTPYLPPPLIRAAIVDRVKWKVVLAVGAVAGGAILFARRKSRRAAADAELWAEATDPIARFGDS